MSLSLGATPSLEISDGVATVTLQRPAQLNRLIVDDLLALERHFICIESDASVQVVVITANTLGQNKPVFCAGYDVQSFNSDSHDPALFEKTVDALANLKPVVIGAINGSVYGGATDLALACDLRIGLQSTEFKMPACALGLHYYPNGLRRYISVLGVNGSKQAFFTARPIPVEKLHEWSVFMDVYQQTAFDETVADLATHICTLAPLALKATKVSLNEISQGFATDVALRERERLSLESQDFSEGRKAFRERRPAKFIGK